MPDDKQFVHLHVHTEFSLLDGLSPIKKIVKRAAEANMQALAITDHGTMFGVIDFYRASKSAGIKPIIGMEAYMAPRGMTDRDPQYDTKPYHLLLLAQNQTGYQNLLKIASAAQLEGYYYRPRIDHDFLAKHAEGLIATSGCLAAEIPRMVEQGREDEALRQLGWYRDVFGAENFYLELQHHDIDILHILNRWLIEKQDYAKIPLLATNDVHYVLDDDYDAHDTLLCIQTGNVKNEENRLRMTDPSYHLRTPEEMWRLFAHVPEALTNSLKIAEMCDVNLDYKGYHLPVFPVPDDFTAETYLRYLCEQGVEWRYGSHADDPEVRNRLEYELNVIHDMGFDTYFLIVWDLCEFARYADIWWNVRGSGAGSVAAYCLGITNIDPLSNSLLFERFLNPGRVTMPDIDLDYPEDRRAEMIQYCAHKYGEDKVAAIITFGTMGSKAAIRDVGRALDMPLPEVDRIARLIPTGAKPVKFEDALGDDPEKALPDLKTAYQQDHYARQIIDTARQLEGVTRHASTHAAGIIVGDKPLIEYIPLHRPTSGGSDENVPVKMVTQFPMETCESIGLLKVDFLGLSTLTIMRKACELIETYHGIRYDLSNIPYRPDPDDPDVTQMVTETFEMLSRGETVGVFQLESQGMRRMLTDMRPQRFEHIVAGISLYRPGPMDYIPTYNKRLHGDEEVKFLHPLLEPILAETFGICVSGDSNVINTLTGQRCRVDQIAQQEGPFVVQGVNENYEPATGRVTHLIYNGEKQVYRITLRNGATIKTTHDHRFLTEDGWKPLNEIRVGERVGSLMQEIRPTSEKPALTLNPSPSWRGTLRQPLPFALREKGLGDEGQKPTSQDVSWQEVVSIQPEGIEAVYDLTVEGIHNFVANNIIVHNCVYQEQIMQIGAKLFGYSLGEADLMRRAVSKKKKEDLQKHREIFVKRGPEHGVDSDTANLIFDDIEFFARYGFNKSHAADYAVLTCQTAFLKCHYPHEYMAALMSVHRDDSAKVSLFAADCSRMGIAILPPDVNASMMDFTIEPQRDGARAIRFGLAAVKNVGVGPLEHIIQQREEGGRFRDLDDFCRRADLRIVQKRALESLIRVGALDQFAPRPTLIAALDRMHSFSADHHKAKEVGQISLFGEATGVDFGAEESILSHLPQVEAVTKREMLRWEKELVGLYVTDHPLKMVMNDLQHAITHTSSELVEMGEAANGKQVTVAGLVTDVRSLITKKGDAMAILTIEDITGTLNAVMFPRTWNEHRDKVQNDSVLVVYGKADTSRGDVQIIVDSATQDFQVVTPVEELRRLEDIELPWMEEEILSGEGNGYGEENVEIIPAKISAAPAIKTQAAAQSHDSRLITDREVPGWIEAEENWSPPPNYTYQDDTGQIIGIEEPDTNPATDDAGRLKPPPAPPIRSRAQEPDEPIVLPRRPRRPRAPEPAPEPLPSRMLVLTIQRSGNAERDQRKLKNLHNRLMEYPGNDRFCFILTGEGKKKARMDFPNNPIGINDDILNFVCRQLGDENVWIDE